MSLDAARENHFEFSRCSSGSTSFMSEEPQTFDNLLFAMPLAPDDQLMLDARNSAQMIEMLLGKSVVPTRIQLASALASSW